MNVNAESSDPVHARTKNVFTGRDSAPWLSKGNRWMEISGGMMQGILHYTSLIHHCCLQISIENYTTRAFQRETSLDLAYSHQTSSDDSGITATIAGKVTSKTQRALDTAVGKMVP